MGGEMRDFTCLNTIVSAAVKQAADETGVLIGRQLSIDAGECGTIDRESFLGRVETAIFVAGIESREGYTGTFYIVFSARDAILFSGLLLGIPAARITEKRNLTIVEPDDTDAFAEIMNQVVGSVKSVFSSSFPGKVCLKLTPPSKFLPEVDPVTEQEPIPDGEYILFSSRLVMEGFETGEVEVFFPTPLAELFAAQVSADAAAETGSEVDELPLGTPETVAGDTQPRQTILILDDDELERQALREMLAHTGMNLVDAPLGGDLGELVAGASAGLVLLGVEDTGERSLAVCDKVRSVCRDSALAMIVCAREWTRTAVLRALNHGARDIVMKPFIADELASKVSRILGPA